MQKLYFDGDWHSSDGQEMIDVIDPSTEKIIDCVPHSNEQDVENCVKSASKAFDEWRWATGIERAELQHEAAGKKVDKRSVDGSLWRSIWRHEDEWQFPGAGRRRTRKFPGNETCPLGF